MRLADTISKKRSVLIIALALSIITAAISTAQWNQAMSAGFGTADWQKHIYAAQTARDSGENAQADIYLNSAFHDAKLLGKQHPFYTITLRHLSDAAYLNHNFALAKDYALKEVEILKPLGDDYQDLVPIYIRLADVAFAEGNLQENKKQLMKAKALKDKALFNPTLRAEILLRMATLALTNNDLTEFRSLTAQAENEWLDMSKAPKTGSNFSDYAAEISRVSLFANKKVARPLREAAQNFANIGMKYIIDNQGTESLAYIHVLVRLGAIQAYNHNEQEEIALFRRGAEAALASRILTRREKAIVLFQYAQPLFIQGHSEEALPMLQQSAAFSTFALKRERIDILFYLSTCLTRLNRVEEAIVVKRDLVKVMEAANRKIEAQRQLREIDVLSARIK